MSDATGLAREKCVACRRDSPRVTESEIAELHPQVADWRIANADGIPRLERTYKFKNFGDALAFSNELGGSADAEGHHPRMVVEWPTPRLPYQAAPHHPRMVVEWGRVGVEWWTHKIRGLHRNDFVMAAKTDVMYAERAGGAE